MSDALKEPRSAAYDALVAAGDAGQAEDIAVVEAAEAGVKRKLAPRRESLVVRMIYGPAPDVDELCSGVVRMAQSQHQVGANNIVGATMAVSGTELAFDSEGKISRQLRDSAAGSGAYGFTVPEEYGGLGLNYSQLACLEEQLAANGLGALAVELSGQLTIGSSALLGYGSDQQRSTFLPQIASGRLIAFALTEVGVGVNAKRVQAWVERDEAAGCWRLNAEAACNKLYITSATHGGLAAIVARKGKGGKEMGLFIVELPDADVEGEYDFHCTSSNVSAFAQNINSRLNFRHFPIPFEQEIQGNGVEVLFYCLRMGRCMLAAMAAGFQNMMAADALHYACQREGVGGLVIKHELPRLALTKILGGALTAQALSHLSLAQDADGADLAGLRDLTKSASARYALESLTACERVIGGRSLDKNSRIADVRSTLHAFGIVEGEDDLIRMGMVKEVTAEFTDRYLKGLLGALHRANMDSNGQPLPEEQRIYRVGPMTLLHHPRRTLRIQFSLLTDPGFWRLLGWVLVNGLKTLGTLVERLVPTRLLPRYRKLPGRLGIYLRISERGLRACRWHYLFLNLFYQLELTRAQLPMQAFGKKIELLASMAAVCCHAARLDISSQHIAEAQAELIRTELESSGFLGRIIRLQRVRNRVARVARDLESGNCAQIKDIQPQAFAHPWD